MSTPALTSDEEIAAVARGLIARSLPVERWTHAAHFAAALWLIDQGREAEMPTLIRAYNEAVGTPNSDSRGYHETITLASLAAARAARAERAGQTLHDVCNALLASPCGRSDWLLAHWSHERLFSLEARRAWTPPDLEPLPFPIG